MDQPRKILCFGVCLVVGFLLPYRAGAQSGTVTDDAFLSSNSTTQLANLNGQGIALVVAGSSATVGTVHVGTTKTFVKFQLQSSLPPAAAAANIAKATLKLFVSPSCNPSGAIDLYPVTSAWTESTLNPSSPPMLASTAFATAIPAGKANSFMVVDVTLLVQEWLEGSANGGIDNDGIALVADTSTTNVVFDSKENIITSHEPRLEIVLVNSGPQGAAGPQGPQGLPGPQGAPGTAGVPGNAATVQVGTTMTVSAGTPASVLNGGTANAAVLNFLIPQGATGLTGPQGPAGAAGQTGPAGLAGPPGPQGQIGPQGASGPQGVVGPMGPAGPQGPAGTGPGGGSSSLLSAFLPGPLTQAYTAASFVPDTPITVTHVTAALKTAPDLSCAPTVLRVTDGSTGQDVRLLGGQAGRDSGPVTLPFSSGANVQVSVQTPANCRVTNPADANLVVEYRGQLTGDQQTCAQSGLACNGICEETQTDPNNCGACGNVCPTQLSPYCIANPNQCGTIQQTCVSGVCGGCGTGLNACSGTCTNVQSDPSNCGACGTACLAGQVCTAGQCMGSFPNGAACVSANQCTGGFCVNGTCSSCGFQHSNGLGESYTDCANPLGTPGNPATYNVTMAQEAANAFPRAGAPSSTSCNGAGAVMAFGSSLGTVVIWVYQGALAGYVQGSALSPTCPTTSSPTWN